MPVVHVHGLPKDTAEEELVTLYREIAHAIIAIRELKLTKRQQVTVFFPLDMMSFGLGDEIVYSIALSEKPERTTEVLGRVSDSVNALLKNRFSNALVEGWCQPIDMARQGYRIQV